MPNQESKTVAPHTKLPMNRRLKLVLAVVVLTLLPAIVML